MDLHIPGRLTIFVGPNAVGKTNIVEAMQLLTAGQSFRHARSADLLRSGAIAGHACIKASDSHRQLDLAMALGQTSRKHLLNGKARRVADIRGMVPSVTFTPDDLDMVKGTPAVRRDALDALGVQLNKNYQVILRDFDKVARHKNRLLKDGAEQMIDTINDLYIKVAAQLQSYRSALFARVAPKMALHYAHLANGEELVARYLPSGQNEAEQSMKPFQPFIKSEALADAVARHRDAELAARRTLVGPNRDRIELTIAGMDAGKFASQGQQRSAVLAWKRAEADTIEEVLGTFPVLLLDDVMSELDPVRRSALVEYLDRDVQAFITTANLEYFDESMLAKATVITLPLEENTSETA